MQNHKIAVDGQKVALETRGFNYGGVLTNGLDFDVKSVQASAFASFTQHMGYRNVADDRANVTYVRTDSAFDLQSGVLFSCVYTWMGTMVRKLPA